MSLRYKCYLFDLDNTLVDTDDIKREALFELGVKNSTTISDIHIRTMAPTKFLRRGSKDLSSYWRVYKNKIKKSAKPITDGLMSVLDDLDSYGMYLGVITASPEKIATAVLRSSGLEKYFGDKIWYSRNKAKTIREVLACFDCDTYDTIYIGDLEKDYIAAQVSNIDFGLALWGCLADDPIIDKVDISLEVPSDLLRLK
jgi:HAD superfamily hydrolase (TIGR01549 family)